MNKIHNWFRNNRTLSILILTALLIRLVIAWLPVNWLLDQGILVDDAFYYFKIAHNITLGNGVSFDGLSSTNGFHPLWLIIILPIFFLSLSKLTLIHLVLTVSAVVGTASVIVLYYLLKRLNVGKKVRFAAVLFLSLLPTALLSGSGIMNGMETSLNVLLILVFLWSFAGFFNKNGLGYKNILLFGAITGLLFLSRTDNSILIVISWLVSFYVFLHKSRWPELKKLFLAGLVALVIVLPWLLWSFYEFGNLIQVSGKAIPFIAHERISTQDWNVLDYLVRYIKNFADSFIYIFGVLVSSKRSPLFLGVVIIFITVTTFVLFGYRKRGLYKKLKNKFKKNLVVSIPILLTPPVFLLVQTIRAIYLRGWYHFSIFPILLILFSFLADLLADEWNHLNSKIKSVFKLAGVIYIFILSLSLANFILVPSSSLSELGKYKTIQELNNYLPPNSIVGAWNAGLYGYFFEKGTIVNLDGVVNNEVYPYIKEHAVGKYVKEKKIQYLVDNRSALLSEYWGDSKPIEELEIEGFFIDDYGREFLWGRLKQD